MLTKSKIVELLKTDKRAVARALVVLNSRQTTDEQRSENTRHLNGRGFRPCHARMGTSMANFFSRNGFLTDRQIAYWRVLDRTGKMRIEIYAGQLLEAAGEKAAQTVAEPTRAVSAMTDEEYMQQAEAAADRAETEQDELNKFMARCRREA